MPQPFDYRLNLPDPAQNVTNTLGLAANLINLKKASAAQDAQQQFQVDVAALGDNPTTQDIINISAKYPQSSEQFKRVYDMASEEDKKTKLNEAVEVYAALDAGKPDIAITSLEGRAAAYENSGRSGQAKTLRNLAELIKTSPASAKITAGLLLSSADPAKFKETFTALQEERRKSGMYQGELVKQGLENGLKKADIDKTVAETKKLGIDTQRAALELKALEKGGGPVDPEKRFDLEKKVRDDYQKRTTSYQAGQLNLDNIKESAKDKSGAGDVALITSFMKMLDPSSVVRETEFATAQDTAGLLTKLQTLATKAANGQFLSQDQRQSFLRLAEKYMGAADKQEQRVRSDLGIVVKNYGLNKENVFGSKAKSEQSVIVGDTTYNRPPNFTDGQWAAYKASQGVE